MPLKILAFILTRLFGFIFKASKETAQSAGGDLVRVFSAISRIGAYRTKEFLATIPIFVEFFLYLMKERDKLDKRRQLLLVGAAAALSSLVGFLIVSVLGSWTVQVALMISFPLLGVPLFFATGLAITTIIVLFIWLVVFVLNKALSDDPAYQAIRDGYLPTQVRQVLTDIEAMVNDGQGAETTATPDASDPRTLYELVEVQLLEQGEKADVADVVNRLEKIEKKLKRKSRQMQRFEKTANRVDQMKGSTPL